MDRWQYKSNLQPIGHNHEASYQSIVKHLNTYCSGTLTLTRMIHAHTFVAGYVQRNIMLIPLRTTVDLNIKRWIILTQSSCGYVKHCEELY